LSPRLVVVLRGGVAIAGILAAIALIVLRVRQHDMGKTLYALHYVVPMILFAAALVSSRLGNVHSARVRDLLVDALAVVVAASRLLVAVIPFSGHMALLTYGLLTADGQLLRGAAIILLLHTTVLKLVVWHDPVTWSVGACLGVLFACLRSGKRWGRPAISPASSGPTS
jgi:hypothetical protein